MDPLDPRVTPARPDLAARHLAGQVEAARFVGGELHEVVAAHAPVRREPRPDAILDTEALMGERVMVYESTEEGWSWVQLMADSHVGYIPSEALGHARSPATHKVTALRTLVFPGPSLKVPPIGALPFGSSLAVARIESPFAVTVDNGFVPLRHLAEMAHVERDFVSVAERFIGSPYLWGGKTGLGLDCSALVQLALTATGVPCPRDSDMQAESLGRGIETAGDVPALLRGDLLFWDGHVAIARDAATLIHANGFHMAVAIEPVADAIARNREAGMALVGVRRLERGLVR